MSAALDVRKCVALASLFACGQHRKVVRHAMRVGCLNKTAKIHTSYTNSIRRKAHQTSNLAKLRQCRRVYAKQTVLSHHRALHGHCVSGLFAMSAALDVRKCVALASLFACGQHRKVVRHAMRVGCLNKTAKIHTSYTNKKAHQTMCFLAGGEGWIRTTEVTDNRFTVCSLWPLGNLSIWSW